MVDSGRDVSAMQFFADAEEMLDQVMLDGVVVGARCGSHAPLALKALKRGLPLFLEKPIATNMADLKALAAANATHSPKVVVSFPLRVTAMVNLAREIIDSGKIGTVEHVQAWANVYYGAVYYQGWYRDESETGGLFLQKATHDFDYINSLLRPNAPVSVCAMTSKQVFHGSHPAGLHCQDCPERTTCRESPYDPARAKPLALDQPAHQMCAFAVDTGNEDSGSAIVRYQSGMHVSYSQNFFVRKSAGSRGARLIGYEGTLEFDWNKDYLTVIPHHKSSVEAHKFEPEGGHGGGDSALAANFLKVITGEEKSIAPLEAGILSGLMCLKARESAKTEKFEAIRME